MDVVSLTDVRGDHLKVIVKPGCSSKDGVSCLLCRFLDPCPFKKRLTTLGQILDRSTIKNVTKTTLVIIRSEAALL